MLTSIKIFQIYNIILRITADNKILLTHFSKQGILKNGSNIFQGRFSLNTREKKPAIWPT